MTRLALLAALALAGCGELPSPHRAATPTVVNVAVGARCWRATIDCVPCVVCTADGANGNAIAVSCNLNGARLDCIP